MSEKAKKAVSGAKTVAKARAKSRRFAVYSAVPMGDWVELSGRSYQVVYDVARRWGMPIEAHQGGVVDLGAVLQWMYGFVKENARHIRAGKGLAGSRAKGSVAMERLRMAKAEREEIRLAADRGQVIPRDQVRTALGRFAGVLRSAGEEMQRVHGPEVLDLWNAGIEDAVREAQRALGGVVEGT